MGMANIKLKKVRINQMSSSCTILSGILVARMHGIDAEKNKIEDTQTTPAEKRAIISASFIKSAGKNISANPAALA